MQTIVAQFHWIGNVQNFFWGEAKGASTFSQSKNPFAPGRISIDGALDRSESYFT
jgi:hypothetical protein